MKKSTDDESYAEFEIEGKAVTGRVSLESGASPSAHAIYSYDLGKRLDSIAKRPPSGYGITHEMKVGFSLKGKTFGLTGAKGFSLLRLEHKASHLVIGTDKVSNDFRFRFGLIGVQADWEDPIFESAHISFPAMTEKGGFPRRISEIVRNAFEDGGQSEAMAAHESIWPPVVINDEVELELVIGSLGSLSTVKRNLYSLTSQVGFSLKVTGLPLSAKDIWERYVVPLSRLMSISAGESISPGGVSLQVKGAEPFETVK